MEAERGILEGKKNEIKGAERPWFSIPALPILRPRPAGQVAEAQGRTAGPGGLPAGLAPLRGWPGRLPGPHTRLGTHPERLGPPRPRSFRRLPPCRQQNWRSSSQIPRRFSGLRETLRGPGGRWGAAASSGAPPGIRGVQIPGQMQIPPCTDTRPRTRGVHEAANSGERESAEEGERERERRKKKFSAQFKSHGKGLQL